MFRRRIEWLLLVFLGVAAGLRLAGLARHSLWHDEGLTLRHLDGGSLGAVVNGLLGSDISLQGHAIYVLALYAWQTAAGDSVLALRLFSGLLGVGAVLVLYFAAKRAFGPTHALWSMGFAAVSAFGILHSQEARPYALAIFLSCVFLWAYVCVRSGDAAEWKGLAAVGVASLAFSTASAFAALAIYGLVAAGHFLEP